MLVLTRKKNQSVILGNDIEIHILEIQRDHIRIGIAAPQSVRILRHELYQAVQAENKAAASSSLSPVNVRAVKTNWSGKISTSLPKPIQKKP
jgi:carbon storage regulator